MFTLLCQVNVSNECNSYILICRTMDLSDLLRFPNFLMYTHHIKH